MAPRPILLGILFLLSILPNLSQADEPATDASQWEVAEIRVESKALADDPFDLELTGVFTSSTGQAVEVPGFYNGERDYLIRFTPPTPGTWTYVTKSSDPSLDGRSGKLKVAAAKKQQRGGVLVDPASARRFVFENGEHYFPIAFECDWLFALDAEREDAIPKTEMFVDTLKESGFNQVVMNVFAYDVNWKKDPSLPAKYEYGSPNVFPFGGTNASPDYSRLNVTYFQRLDRVIEHLNQNDIIAHLMIYVWNKQVNWPEARSDADNRYFDYVAKRYQAYPNLVWDISKEALGYGHNDVTYIHNRIERLQRLDSYDRLITVHDYGYCQKFPENVDFVSVQLWTSELYSVMRNVLSRIPGKPILNIEHGGYERGPYVVFTGNYTSPEVCLERAYQCVFAGTYPTHYWQGAAWNVLIPDISELPENSRPRLEYYRHLNSLVEKYDIAQLRSGDKKSNAGFCLHNNDGLYLYYVPQECEFFGLRLPKELQGQAMSITWFDPFQGSYSTPQEMKITQWPSVAKPQGDGFRILIVQTKPGSPSNNENRP